MAKPITAIGGVITSNALNANLDALYGTYDTVADAINAIGQRRLSASCVGLTVGIKNTTTGVVTEYWVQPITGGYGLVPKGGSGSQPIEDVEVNILNTTDPEQASGEMQGGTLVLNLPKGAKGDDGEQGETGADGKSAYQVWLDTNGWTAAEHPVQEYINSLKAHVSVFVPVAYDETAAGKTIGQTYDFALANPIAGSLVIMPNAAQEATGSILFAVSVEGNTATYTRVGYVDIDTSNFITSSQVDNTQLANSAANALAKAGDVQPIVSAMGGMTFKEVKQSVGTPYTSYLNGKSWAIAGQSGTAKLVEIPIVGEVKYIRFLGLLFQINTTSYMGYGFKDANGDFIYCHPFEDQGGSGSLQLKEYKVPVPFGAVTFVTEKVAGASLLNEGNFYCYFQYGKNVLNSSSLWKKIEPMSEWRPKTVSGSGYYYSNTTTFYRETSGTYSSALCDVSGGQYVRFTTLEKANEGASQIGYVFLDENYQLLSNAISIPYNTGKTLGELTLKIPTGAHYLVSCNKSATYNPSDFSYYVLYEELPNTKTSDTKSQIEVDLVSGLLSSTTGNFPAAYDEKWMMKAKHCPKFYKVEGSVKFDIAARFTVLYYDNNLSFIRTEGNSGTEFEILHDGYIRVNVFNYPPYESFGLPNKMTLTGVIAETFGNRSADEGFQNLWFPVRINTKGSPTIDNNNGLDVVDYQELTSNFGVLHLPETYSRDGAGTPLIIYLHGAAERYTINSTRFGNNCRYSPEWSAAGYAQLDVDMIPQVYNFTDTNTCGTGDDTACVEAAYEWVIQHFNIRRDGVYLFGRSRGAMGVLGILSRLNQVRMPVICALTNAGANFITLYGLRNKQTTNWWAAFCQSMGLTKYNPPVINPNQVLVSQSDIVTFLTTYLDVWWGKASACLGMMVENGSQYKTAADIWGLLVSSYGGTTDVGKTFIEDFLNLCKFRSPVPLRFDWCVGDTIQTWNTPSEYGNYARATKNAFVGNMINGNAVYRQWPSCAGGEPHYHEKFNLMSEDYMLPNGAVVENASMAQIEWMLWAKQYDNRLGI